MKYTPEQLRTMAREFLAAYAANDARSTIVLNRLAARGYMPLSTLRAIEQLAEGGAQ